MTDFHIYIGYREVSSWSLRGWLPLRKTGVAFEETLIRYRLSDHKQRLLEVSPVGQGAAARPPARRAARSRSGIRWRSANTSPSSSRRRSCGRRTRSPAPSPARWRPRCIRASGRSASICRWRCSSASRSGSRTSRGPRRHRAGRRPVARGARDLGGERQGGPWLFGHFTIADGDVCADRHAVPHLRRRPRFDLPGLHGRGARRPGFPGLGGAGARSDPPQEPLPA